MRGDGARGGRLWAPLAAPGPAAPLPARPLSRCRARVAVSAATASVRVWLCYRTMQRIWGPISFSLAVFLEATRSRPLPALLNPRRFDVRAGVAARPRPHSTLSLLATGFVSVVRSPWGAGGTPACLHARSLPPPPPPLLPRTASHFNKQMMASLCMCSPKWFLMMRRAPVL